MNTIILSAPVSDIDGVLQFKFDTSKTEIYSLERRVARRATLDGSSVFEDYGFSHTDRTFVIGARLNGTQLDALTYLLETYPSIVVSIVDGLYLAALQDTKVKGSDATIRILIKEKLA